MDRDTDGLRQGSNRVTDAAGLTHEADFAAKLETKVKAQLRSQRVGYLLGAGSSHLSGIGYPLAFELWDRIANRIPDVKMRADIQTKLDTGANGIEHALDLLDDGGAQDTPYRHLVTAAVAGLMMPLDPPLNEHVDFVRHIGRRAAPSVKVFSLNYDPLIERAASHARVRLVDGFWGSDQSYFDPSAFEERIVRIRGTGRWKQFDETVRPIHLLKLHGSLGWYECPTDGIRRCAFGVPPPAGTRRLMIPPQRRKASDTMHPPYSALWSEFRGCLGHDAAPINRLACIGYGFGDEHINAVIEGALGRTDFTLLIFAKALPDIAWIRWSLRPNVVVVTESRCSVQGLSGPGHQDLWNFARLAQEV
jgi:hypothetical protein